MRERGLGRELLHWGIARLRGKGAGGVKLVVQALNERATRLYRTAGFVPVIEWPQFVLPTDPPVSPPRPVQDDPALPGRGWTGG